MLPLWKNGEIQGNSENIEHYIGEAYFLRALAYYNKLVALGDFPIVRQTFVDDMEQLTAASKRMPRNEVARFIISDLDSLYIDNEAKHWFRARKGTLFPNPAAGP